MSRSPHITGWFIPSLLLLLAGLAMGQVPARGITSAEYFWDTDPGQGLATPLPASDAAFDETIEKLLGTMIPLPATPGPHSFNARSQDIDGNWGSLFTTIVYVADNDLASPRPAGLVQAEYFWDTDPGQGNGTALFASDGALDETVEAVLGTMIPAPLASGPHTFNVRVKDKADNWSAPFVTTVHVSDSDTPTPGRRSGLVSAEYFWDTDPGQGNGTALFASDGALNETVEALLGTMIPLPAASGPHSFHVRVKDIDNNWSRTFATIVHVSDNASPTPPRRSGLVSAEYFWDIDPGQGSGTPLLATDGTFDETVEAVIGSGLALPGGPGAHTFNVRTRDADGIWSPAFTTIVEVTSSTPTAPPTRDLVEAEYFWNSDPGQGNGTSFFALDGSFDETVEALFRNNISTPGPFGPHLFSVRTRDDAGNWSPTFTTVVSNVPDFNKPGWTDDTDKDSLSTITEYFLGTDPGTPDKPSDYFQSGSLPDPGGGPTEHLYLRVLRRHAAPEIDYRADTSSDLTNWVSQPNWITQTVDSTNLLEFTATPSIDSEAARYIRLFLEYQP